MVDFKAHNYYSKKRRNRNNRSNNNYYCNKIRKTMYIKNWLEIYTTTTTLLINHLAFMLYYYDLLWFHNFSFQDWQKFLYASFNFIIIGALWKHSYHIDRRCTYIEIVVSHSWFKFYYPMHWLRRSLCIHTGKCIRCMGYKSKFTWNYLTIYVVSIKFVGCKIR